MAQIKINYDEAQKIWSGDQDTYQGNQNKSVGELIYEQLQQHPHNISQICDSDNTILTKEQMLMNAVRIATFLQNSGLREDDVVATTARNSTYLTPLIFGCFFVGTPIHILSPGFREQIWKHLFHITKPKIIFCDAEDYEKVSRAADQLEAKIYVMSEHDNRKVCTISDILKTSYDQKFRPAKLTRGMEQTLAILCTSGTTGTPKIVLIDNSHRLYSRLRNLREDDVLYTPSPLDWLSALGTVVSAAVYGKPFVLSANMFEPTEFLRMLVQYKIKYVLITPAQICELLNCEDLSVEKLKGVRYIAYVGSGCPLETQKKLKSFLPNARCIFVYGSTEVGNISTLNVSGNEQAGSVGRLMPGIRIKIINEHGTCQGVNQVGEICCDNGHNWVGYYGNVKATREVMDEAGWFHTGDMGYVDEEGSLYVVDRKNEMLKYMDMVYYPNELEEIISKMPDVMEVCVFGVFDERVGDAAAAAVVRRLDCNLSEKDVIDFVARNVAAKCKELNGGVFFLEEFKKLLNGKLNRRDIKDQCLAT